MPSLPSSAFAILLAIFAVGLAVPTGAITVGVTQPVDTSERFELAPSQSANGQYATVEDGELELSFEKLNDRATTTAHDVFTVTGTSADLEAVWFEHDLEGVTFYEGSDPSAEIDRANPLELADGETASVGVAVDTLERVPASGSFDVYVELESEDETNETASSGPPGAPSDGNDEPQPRIELTGVEYSTTDLAVGDTLVVNATYENRGDAAGEVTAELIVDGIVVETRTISLEPGERRTVRFERTIDRAGTFEVGVDDRKVKTISASVSDGGGADIVVSDVGLDADRVAPNETVNASATFVNAGTATGNVTAELAVGGTVVDAERVELEPGEARTITFERQFEEYGTHEVAINGIVAGEVTVSDPPVFAVGSRVIHGATTATVALPMAIGILFVISVANRRRDLWP